MSRHPELARLIAEYEAILAKHNQGHLSAEATQQAVGTLWTTDGAGYEWSIDSTSGRYVRRVPGEQPQFAEEHQFAATLVTPPPGIVNSAPLTTGLSPLDIPSQQLPYSDAGVGEPATGLKALIPVITGHKHFKWAAIAFTLLILFIGVKACSGTTTVDPNPGGVPISSSSSIPTDTIPVVTQSPTGFADDSQTETTNIPVAPTADEVDNVKDVIVSGHRDLFGKAFAVELSAVQIALQSATYAGYFENGITVDLGVATPGLEAGQAESLATLSDNVTGSGIAKATLSWIFVEGSWKITVLPVWQ